MSFNRKVEKRKEKEEKGLKEGLQDKLQDFFGDILPSKEHMHGGDDEDAHASNQRK